MFKCKKLMSLALAGVMAASLAVPAFADDTPANTTKVDGAYQATTIAVTVPGSGKAIINPYGLPVTIYSNDDDHTKDVSVKGEQIVMAEPTYISNESGTDLDVSATITTTLGSKNLTLATAAITAKETKKTAFVYFEYASSALTGAKADVTAEKVANEFGTSATWKDYAASNTNQVVLKSGATTKQVVGKLAAAKMDATDPTQFSEYEAGSIGLFRLTGSCVQEPATAWAADDTFTASIAFTFTPSTTTAASNG
jgi:hypothetical protein